MKKIVGILGMAAMLASAAFAADPAADFKIAEFKGDASLDWNADFTNGKMGMSNATNASLKVGLITAGDKATTGDGVWGEIGIKFEKPLEWAFKQGDATVTVPSFAAPKVTTAKIHLVDGDFSAAFDIMTPDLKIGDVSAPSATALTATATCYDVTKNLKAGFAIDTKLDKVFSFKLKFMDKGFVDAKNQNYGLGFEAGLLAVPNLTANAKAAFNFEDKSSAFGVDAGYTYKFDDKLYLNPGAAFAMYKLDTADAVMNAEAGVLFGWGLKKQKAGFKYVTKDESYNEGVSVGVQNNLVFKDNTANTTTLAIGLYDQSLFELLDLDAETFGVLKVGVQNNTTFGVTTNRTNKDDKTWSEKLSTTNAFAAGLRYSITPDPIYIDLGFDISMSGKTQKTTAKGENASDLQKGCDEADKVFNDLKDNKTYAKIAWNAALGSKKVIDNTDLYVKFSAEYDGKTEQFTENKVTVGTKISF